MIKYSSLSTEHYSAIIFTLLDGDKTPAQIADVCNKAYTTIKEELNVLKEEKLIEITKLVDENRKRKNEKYIVKLKFGMLCVEFINYVLNKTNKAKLTKILYRKLLKNPYLLEILYRSLMNHKTSTKKSSELRTVEDIFEKITMQIIYVYPPHDELKADEKKDKSLHTFLQFTRSMEDYLVPDLADTTQSFYDEIREDRVKFTYLNFQKK